MLEPADWTDWLEYERMLTYYANLTELLCEDAEIAAEAAMERRLEQWYEERDDACAWENQADLELHNQLFPNGYQGYGE
jgi:hypothetical protein